jgi:hypothetical protein
MKSDEKNSECYVLHKDDFWRIFKGCDEARNQMLEDGRTRERELFKRCFGFFPKAEKDPGLKNPTFIKKLNDYAGADEPKEMRPKNGIEFRNILQVKAGILPDYNVTPKEEKRRLERKLHIVQRDLNRASRPLSPNEAHAPHVKLHRHSLDSQDSQPYADPSPVVVPSFMSRKNVSLYTHNIIGKQYSRADLSE